MAKDNKDVVAFRLQFGQWTLHIFPGRYELVNLGPNGERRYYRVVPGQYGEPLIDQEPDLAFTVPTANMRFYRAKTDGGTEQMALTPEDKITGVVCRNGPRFSLTTAKNKGVDVRVNPDGSIQVGDRTWWLCALFCPDAQRFTPNRWVAYLTPEKPCGVVFVAEMADVLHHWDQLQSAVANLKADAPEMEGSL